MAALCQVRKSIGAYATPDYVILTPGLPKTRSGKIMRRILRKIISLEVRGGARAPSALSSVAHVAVG